MANRVVLWDSLEAGGGKRGVHLATPTFQFSLEAGHPRCLSARETGSTGTVFM